jgi:hypothetical protein
MEAHITLYGQHAERFQEIQEALEEERGLDLSNAATVREMMVRIDLQ